MDGNPFSNESNQKRLVEVRAIVRSVLLSITDEEHRAGAAARRTLGSAAKVLVVSGRFWDDHTSRDLDSVSVEIRSTNGTNEGWVVLAMNPAEFRELVDDAAHYSTGYDEEDFGDLTESARRTIVALWEQRPQDLQMLADARTRYGDLAWALGIENRRKGAIITG
jgi:hypothetical protein